MKNSIVLSICIPTFNRAEYLEKTLLSIVNQKRFQETYDVEIVISDNCSTDNTREIVERYVRTYGDKIRYFCNTENIKDANFEKVLGYGKGSFLKLNNDTLLHMDNTLNIIVDTINQNAINKDVLFFSNGKLKNINKYRCVDLDDFVKKVSFYSTWIACFGIWKTDFDLIDCFSRKANLQLVQTDVLLRLIRSKRSVFVDNSEIFNSIPPANKGGYNIYQVFVANYLGLYDEYRQKKQISRFTLFNEKSKLLRYFLLPWTISLVRDKSQYTFDRKGALSTVFNKYMFHPLFYLGLFYLFLRFVQINSYSMFFRKK